MSSFIPSLHFRPAKSKLTKEFCQDVINYYYYNNQLVNLLEGKDVDEIEQYTTGEIDMKPFMRMFRSLSKQLTARNNPNISKRDLDAMVNTKLSWNDPLALIPPKLDSAVAISQKQPMDITVTCQDPLAQKKKQEDLDFLKNKQKITDFMQPLYDSMALGKADLGGTKHSDVVWEALPLDLDVDDPAEFKVFAEVIYNLAPESAFEVILEHYKDVKKFQMLRYKETFDQFKFAISCNRCMDDKITELPNYEYLHPGQVRTSRSILPDFSDREFTVVDLMVTPMELLNYFPDEIPDLNALQKIVNGKAESGVSGSTNGYYAVWGGGGILPKENFSSYKMNLKYCEIKSPDYVLIGQRKNSRFTYITDDESKAVEKRWGQNTYRFYWLEKTELFFGIDRLGYAFRAPGQEVFSNFSINIIKTKEKSAVELSIRENKKALVADVKAMAELVAAQPDGYAVNAKAIRNFIASMVNDPDGEKYTVDKVMEEGKEKNIWPFEPSEFDKGTGQGSLPVTKIKGGLSESFREYAGVVLMADQNIGKHMNINDQLTGQTPSPDMLIGLQKLLVNASINGLNYISEALLHQYKNVFNIWAYYIQQSLKKDGPAKEAITRVIGSRKIDLIKGLNEIPLHQMGAKISLGQREEERAIFKQSVMKAKDEKILNSLDVWMILNTPNPKDAMILLATKEAKFEKKQQQRQQALLDNQKDIAEQQGQNMVQNTAAQTDGKIKVVQASGEVEAQLLQLGAQLGLTKEKMTWMAKAQLQRERGQDQKEKNLETLGAKNAIENQKAF